MSLSRRHLFHTGALAAAGLALGVPAARAAAPLPSAQAAGVQRLKLGSAVVTALSDGMLPLQPALLQGTMPEAAAQHLERQFLAPDAYRASINAYLYAMPDRLVLIDTGTPGSFSPTVGQVPSQLAAAGVAPEQIDLIVLTHLHPDHIGNLVTAEGTARFPTARLTLTEAEHRFWTDPANRAAAPADFQPFFDLAAQMLQVYAGRVDQHQAEAQILPGLTSQGLPGHTPGHAGYLLEQEGQSLLIWGDIVHVGPVQLAEPQVTIAFDADGAMAAATRARILDRVASDRLRIAGSHLPFPGIGHIAREGQGYRFVPVEFPSLF